MTLRGWEADASGWPVVRLRVLPVLAASAVATAAFVIGSTAQQLPPAGAAVVLFTMAPLSAIAAAALLALRSVGERDATLRWAAAGLAVGSLAMMLQLISFPAVAPGGGPFGTDGQGSALLYLGWHVAVAVGAVAGALSLDTRWLRWFVGAGILLSLAAALPALTPSTPVLLRTDGSFPPALVVGQTTVAAMTAVAVAVWLVATGIRPSASRGWVVVALSLSAYDLILNALAGERFSAIWWSSLGVRAATYSVLLAGLLWSTVRQLSRGQLHATEELSVAARTVETWTDATEVLLSTASRLAATATTAEVVHVLRVSGIGITGLAAHVLRSDPGGGGLRGIEGDGTPRSSGLASPSELASSVAADAMRQGRVIEHESQSRHARPAGWAADPPGTVVAVPLLAAAGGIGVLVLSGKRLPALTDLKRELLLGIGRQSAVALQRATVVEELAEVNTLLAARIHALVEASPDAIVTVDGVGTIIEANGRVLDLFGYPSEQLVGEPVEILVPEGLRALHRQHRNTFAREPRIRPMGAGRALAGRRADGSEFPIEIVLAPVPAGVRFLVMATVRDMTEIHRSQQSLRESEESFRRLFEQASVGVAAIGLDGTFQRVNRRLTEITGFSVEQLEATSIEALTDPDELAADRDGFAALVAGEVSAHRAERRYLHAAGHSVWVSVSVGLVNDADGNPSHFLSQVEDISDRKRYEHDLKRLAEHDHLTGLFNRRRFEEELVRELARCRRGGGPGAVLAMDVDNFKAINDTRGHPFGDQVITRVAEVCQRRLRVTDVIARLGGDEFEVLLPGVGVAEAELVAWSLLEAVREQVPIDLLGEPRSVTASIGIATFDRNTSSDEEQLLREADIALYDAKDSGRNCVRLYSPAQDRQNRLHARLSWAERIRRALDEDRMVLHAQPIVSLNGCQVPWHELLLRMRDPGGELIPPATFIYIAERFDLAHRIDRWVLHEAVGLLARLQRGTPDARIGINLSATFITDPDLPDLVSAELESAGADGRGLCLEITETAAITNIDQARVLASQLSQLGCQLALDDFGSGFSSFFYLKYLTADYLKIDGEFVHNLAEDGTNQLVVRSLVDIARGLGKHTIAEHVEDRHTCELLRTYGVDYAQGFLIAKPKPLRDVDLALRQTV